MAEEVKLTITAEDLASGAIRQVKESLDSVPLSAAQAAKVFEDLGISEASLRQVTDGNAQSWGTLTRQLTEGAPAIKQVEQAMASFQARSDVAGDNIQKLQSALDQGELAYRRLALTSGQQAPDAMQKFAFSIQEGQTRLNGLVDVQRLHTEQSNLNASALRFLSQETDHTTGAFGLFENSATRSALAIAGIYSAVQVASQVIRTAVGEIGSFDLAMREVYTIGIKSAEVQEQLREQVLQLPPALGSSTELAKGLYQTLSANIDPAKAVEFVGAAAKLATAGLANMDTTVQALTKTMHAYQIPTERVNDVSEILFKTVVYGQGRLEAFASAFPNVTQQASALGISLEEVAGFLAALSNAFRSPEAAATGLRGMLNSLVQENAKYAASGIDVQKVISEEGLIGLMRKLKDVTGGNLEEIRKFVPEVRAGQAALAAMGPEYQHIIDFTGKMKEKTDEVGRATELITGGMTGSWTTFKNSFDRLMQEVAPLVLIPATATAQGLTQITTDIKNFVHDPMAVLGTGLEGAGLMAKTLGRTLDDMDQSFAGTKGPIDASAAALGGWRDEGARAADAAAVLGRGLQVTTPPLDEQQQKWDKLREFLLNYNTEALHTMPTMDEVRKAAAALNEGLRELSSRDIIAPDKVERQTRAAISNLDLLSRDVDLSFHDLAGRAEQTIQTVVQRTGRLPESLLGVYQAIVQSGKGSVQEVEASVEKVTDLVLKRTGAIPPVLQDMLSRTKELTEADTNEMADAWNKFGLETQGMLQQLAKEGVRDFGLLLDSGNFTGRQLLPVFRTLIQQINEGEFTKLPEGFATQMDKMNGVAQKFGQTMAFVARDVNGNLQVMTDREIGFQDTSSVVFRNVAENARARFLDLLNDGNLTWAETERNVHSLVNHINTAEFPTLPSSWEKTLDLINQIAQQKGGDLVTTYQDIFGRMRAVQGTMVDDVERQFARLRSQTAQEAQNAAQAWLKEFTSMANSGQYTHEQLVQAARTGTALMKQAYDTLPPEFTSIMERLGITADKTAQHMSDSFKKSSRDILDYWDEVDKKINQKTPGSTSSHPTEAQGQSLSELTAELQRAQAAAHSNTGVYANLYTDPSLTAYIQSIEDKIAKLRQDYLAQQEAAQHPGSLTQTQTSTRTGSQTTTSTSTHTGSGMDTLSTATALPSSPYGISTPSSYGSGALGSLDGSTKKPIIPDSSGAISVYPTGASPTGTAAPSGTTSASQIGGTTVHAPINVSLNVTSPISRIDAQNLVADLTPALQEAINRNQLRMY
jgi:TP901 family phage tail tape measure protein